MKEVVKGKFNSTYWNAEVERECEVVDKYFYNGEGWYKLRDTDTGEVFDSPDSFWEEV